MLLSSGGQKPEMLSIRHAVHGTGPTTKNAPAKRPTVPRLRNPEITASIVHPLWAWGLFKEEKLTAFHCKIMTEGMSLKISVPVGQALITGTKQ